MKKLNSVLLIILLCVAGLVSAAQSSKTTYAEIELPLKIKLSNDGTGIIQGVTCGECKYKFGKITKNTEAYANGVKVDLLRARERAGKMGFVQFVRATGEIMAIHWNE